ncbi:MAG: hypothetical protein HZB59_08300 [Ignavibacteriales bacterium]|nr:hypothetical protein [Ignavibacteriales bacterium]
MLRSKRCASLRGLRPRWAKSRSLRERLRIVARATPSMGEEPFAPRTSPIIGKNSNVRPSLRLVRPLRFSRATLVAIALRTRGIV